MQEKPLSFHNLTTWWTGKDGGKRGSRAWGRSGGAAAEEEGGEGGAGEEEGDGYPLGGVDVEKALAGVAAEGDECKCVVI